MRAVLLGAGYGTRLAPLTDRVPKILVPVDGEPLLARQLRYLAANGISEVALNMHHLESRVRDYLATTRTPVPVRLYPEPELLGTAGALRPMRALLDEPFVLLYGDVVTDLDLGDLASNHRGTATLSYYVAANVEGKGVLELDDDGCVVSFVEKPEAAAPGAVNAGIYALSPSILDLIPEGGDFGYDVWPHLVEARELYGYRTDAYVADIGSLEMLRQVENDVRNGVVQW